MQTTDAEQHRNNRWFSLSGVADACLPVLVAVPHAGRYYPDEIASNLRVAAHVLERLEDRHADMLLAGVENSGCATLTAHAARAWIDLNRAPNEIDPQMISDAPRTAFAQPSMKVRGGLGLVPRRLADHGELWHRPWPRAEIAARISGYHDPYHETLAATLAVLHSRFGCALLIDLHSMPPLRQEGASQPAQIVVGDRFGRSAGGRLCDLAVQTLAKRGFCVALNHPYAGGYVLERHGRPVRGIHALQIEVDRTLYLDSDLHHPGPGLPDVCETLGALVRTMAEDLLRTVEPDGQAIAAE